jgi:hypothetical protein
MFRAVKRNRLWLRLIALFCLITVQVQAWAALAIPCGHSRLSAHVDSACESHRSEPETQPPEHRFKLLDCHKCALGYALGVYHPTTSSIPVSLTLLTEPRFPGRDPHFYRFIPDPLLRPPIAARTAC